jgi:hypothetical protein
MTPDESMTVSEIRKAIAELDLQLDRFADRQRTMSGASRDEIACARAKFEQRSALVRRLEQIERCRTDAGPRRDP